MVTLAPSLGSGGASTCSTTVCALMIKGSPDSVAERSWKAPCRSCSLALRGKLLGQIASTGCAVGCEYTSWATALSKRFSPMPARCRSSGALEVFMAYHSAYPHAVVHVPSSKYPHNLSAELGDSRWRAVHRRREREG